MENPDCLEDEEFANSTIILPLWVLDELDDLKRNKEKAWYARRASRNIHKYATQGLLSKGVATKKGSMLIGESRCELPVGINPTTDNKIILLAQRLGQKSPHREVTVVSRDTNLSIKASIFGVKVQEYTKKIRYVPYAPFPGYIWITLCRDLIGQFFRDKAIDINTVIASSTRSVKIAPNACIYLSFEGAYALGIYKKELGIIRLVPKPDSKDAQQKTGIHPRNCEQAFAYALLTDPDIRLVALFGRAGSGKTLMSMLTGYEQVMGYSNNGISHQTFKRIIVIRSPIEASPSIGFLPRSIDEKFNPYTDPVYENLDLVIKRVNAGILNQSQYCAVDHLIDTKVLEISPPNYMRGRTLRDAFVIIDETQNFTREQIKMLTTRPDETSKIVLIGDVTQVDNPALREQNGLTHVISRFIGQELFGYTTMNIGKERSLLAKLAAELL